jgi:stalled ribosome rescue protein Dom34
MQRKASLASRIEDGLNPTPGLDAPKMMSSTHAVVAIAHDHAQILEFDAQHLSAGKVRAHTHPTAQHGSGVRSEHEFFGHVCDAIDSIAEVLVTGPRVAVTDFGRYVRKHRPATSSRILGYEVVDRPTQNQLIALARQFFIRVGGVPVQDVAPEDASS